MNLDEKLKCHRQFRIRLLVYVMLCVTLVIIFNTICIMTTWSNFSVFLNFSDNRFILKQMSSIEVDIFEKFGPEYFKYVSSCYMDQVCYITIPLHHHPPPLPSIEETNGCFAFTCCNCNILLILNRIIYDNEMKITCFKMVNCLQFRENLSHFITSYK